MPHTTQKSAKPRQTVPAKTTTRPIGVLAICIILMIIYGLVPLLKRILFALFTKDMVLFPDLYISLVQIGNILIALGFIVICFLAIQGIPKARIGLIYLSIIRFGIFGIFPPVFLLIAANPPPNIAKILASDFKVSLVFLIITLWYFSRKKTKAFYLHTYEAGGKRGWEGRRGLKMPSQKPRQR